MQFGLLNNNKVIKVAEGEPLLLTYTEELEIDQGGALYTKYYPVDQVFVYDKSTGEKIHWWMYFGHIQTNEQYKDVVVTYRYDYLQGATVLKIGQQFLNGFLELEGKTRVKDDTSGLVTTGIIKIPKLKLMSGLSIRMGAQANPVVGTFTAEGVPVESRRDSYVMEFDFLNNDIDSDM